VRCIRYETKPFHVFLFFVFYIVFYVYNKGFKDILVHHAYRGTSRPMEMSALGHHGDSHVAVEHGVAVGGL
jgi:hypothetical protein